MPEHKKGLQAIPAEKGKSMAREKKTKTNDLQKPVSVDVSKLTQGISLVFTGVVKMLEAMGSAIEGSLVLNTANVPALDDKGENGGEKENKAAVADNDRIGASGNETNTAVAATTASKAKSVADAQEDTIKPKSTGSVSPSVTTDDITKIIVRKIKQNKANNERIGLVLKTYGVERVSDLKPEQYEAFITDLAAL